MALTLFLFLRHDCVAQSQQTEEGLSIWVSVLHRLHQSVVVKHKFWISHLVPGEVHSLCLLQSEK